MKLDELIIKERKLLTLCSFSHPTAEQYVEAMHLGEYQFFSQNEKYLALARERLLEKNVSTYHSPSDLYSTLDLDLDEVTRIYEETLSAGSEDQVAYELHKALTIEKEKYIKSDLMTEYTRKFLETEDKFSVIEEFEQKFFSIQKYSSLVGLSEEIRQINEDYLGYLNGTLQVIKSGIPPLDNIVMGLTKGSIWVVGAFSGVGKTHYLTQISMAVLGQNRRVLFVSNEMDEQELLIRIGSHKAKVYEFSINVPQEYPKEAQSLIDAVNKFSETDLDKIFISRSPNFEKALRKMKLLAEFKKCDVICIDYLQNFMTDKDFHDERSKLAYICSELLDFSKVYKIPLVISSQLVSESANTFKGAQDIRNLATVGLILERNKDATFAMSEGVAERAKITVIKSRKTGIGTVYGYYQGTDPAFHHRTDYLTPEEIETYDFKYKNSRI